MIAVESLSVFRVAESADERFGFSGRPALILARPARGG